MKTLWEKGKWSINVSAAVTPLCIDILPCVQVSWNKPTRYIYGGAHIVFRWLVFYFNISFSEECLFMQEYKANANKGN